MCIHCSNGENKQRKHTEGKNGTASDRLHGWIDRFGYAQPQTVTVPGHYVYLVWMKAIWEIERCIIGNFK